MMKLIVCCLLLAAPAFAVFSGCDSGAPLPDTVAVSGCQPADAECVYNVGDNVIVDVTKVAPVDTATLLLKITAFVLGLPIDVTPADNNGCNYLVAPSACPVTAGSTVVGQITITITSTMQGLSADIEASVAGDASELVCQRIQVHIN